jgi:thiol-disulfide isomerase/thioredoxin
MKRIISIIIALMLTAGVALAEAGGGTSFTFATTDIAGNTVTSAEAFAGNKITMVNLWATWCPPCVGELGELAQIHQRLREMDCGVVGILIDSDQAGAIGKARFLMEENGIGYPVLVLSEDMYNVLSTVELIPTTFFVDSNGNILGTPIVGALPEEYIPAVQALL